jgi:pullulanase
LLLGAPLDIAGGAYEVSVEGFGGSARVFPRGVLDDTNEFYDAQAVLGATYRPEATTFRVFAPTARTVQVVHLRGATGDKGRAPHDLHMAGKGIWEGKVDGDLEGRFYLYKLDDHDREVLDIYCVNAVDSSRRARITDLSKTNPPNWDSAKIGPPLASPVDMVVYEMHVRDFTIAANSGVEHKGKYLGFAQAGAHLPEDDAIKTGLDNLAELGITHVQLLPVQDFDNDETSTNYNWGYVTIDYNSPEGWYATNINDESRIRELKQLVAALHQRGIGVIMDVVYNHTANNAPFNSLVPRYYYRFLPDGSYSNGSGCGNDFRSEAPMGRKYIIDTLKYWVQEYGIDGFRFDLMALIDLDTMKDVERELRAIKPGIVLYGEPWGGGGKQAPVRPTNKQTIRGTHIGAFNDNIRNALVGSPFEKNHAGFVQDGSNLDNVLSRHRGKLARLGAHARAGHQLPQLPRQLGCLGQTQTLQTGRVGPRAGGHDEARLPAAVHLAGRAVPPGRRRVRPHQVRRREQLQRARQRQRGRLVAEKEALRSVHLCARHHRAAQSASTVPPALQGTNRCVAQVS